MSNQSNEVWKFTLNVRSLNLKFFRQFEELNIDFNSRITLLVGENGCGKTSVLEALAKLLTIFTEIIRTNTKNVDVSKFFPPNDINNKSSATSIQIELDWHIDSGEPVLPQITKENIESIRSSEIQNIDKWGKNREIRANQLLRSVDLHDELIRIDNDVQEKIKKVNADFQKHLEILTEEEGKSIEREVKKTDFKLTWYVSRNRDPFEPGFFGGAKELVERVDDFQSIKSNKELNISLPVLVYYACEKYNLGSTDTAIGLDPLDTYYNSLTGDTFSLHQFIDWYKWQDRLSKKTEDYSLIKEINSRIQILFNGGENGLFKDIRVNYYQNPNGDFELFKIDTWIEAKQLSSGEKMILALVGDLIKRIVIANPNNKNPFDTASGIVLIDEIDLHLHAKWQREILERLYKEMFPNIQFIIATHAPLVIQRFDGDLVRVLIYDQSSGKVGIRKPKFKAEAEMRVILKETMGVNAEINLDYLDEAESSCQKNNFEDALESIKKIDCNRISPEERKKRQMIFNKIKEELKISLADPASEEPTIAILEKHLEGEVKDDFTIILGSYKNNRRHQNIGMLDNDEANRNRVKFLKQTTDLLGTWKCE